MSPRHHFVWRAHNIKRMLEMVKERPVLWKPDLNTFKHKNNRAVALKEIEKDIGIPALEIKKKLHNMRCTFRRQVKAARSSGPDENYYIRWEYFDAMKFMYETSAGDLRNMEENEDKKDAFLLLNIDWETQNPPVTLPSPTSPMTPQLSPAPSTVSSIAPPSIKSFTPKKRKKGKIKNLSLLNKCVSMMDKNRDDNDIFGEFISSEIRNLPRDLKAKAKKQILQVLLDVCDEFETREQTAATQDCAIQNA